MGQCISRDSSRDSASPESKPGHGVLAREAAKEYPFIAELAGLISDIYISAGNACVLKGDCDDFMCHVWVIEKILVERAPQLEKCSDSLAKAMSTLECTFHEASEFVAHFADRKYLAPRSLAVFLSSSGTRGEGTSPFAAIARALSSDAGALVMSSSSDSASKELQWAAQQVDQDYLQSRELLALAARAGGVGALLCDEEKMRRVEEVIKAPLKDVGRRPGPGDGMKFSCEDSAGKGTRLLVDDVSGIRLDPGCKVADPAQLTMEYLSLGGRGMGAADASPSQRSGRSASRRTSSDGAEGLDDGDRVADVGRSMQGKYAGQSRSYHGASLYYQLMASRERSNAASRSSSFTGAVLGSSMATSAVSVGDDESSPGVTSAAPAVAGGTGDMVTPTPTGTDLVWSAVEATDEGGGVMRRLSCSSAAESMHSSVDRTPRASWGASVGRSASRSSFMHVVSLKDGMASSPGPSVGSAYGYGHESPAHLPEGKGFSRADWQDLLSSKQPKQRTEDSASDIHLLRFDSNGDPILGNSWGRPRGSGGDKRGGEGAGAARQGPKAADFPSPSPSPGSSSRDHRAVDGGGSAGRAGGASEGGGAGAGASGRSPFYNRDRTGGGWKVPPGESDTPRNPLANGQEASHMDTHQVNDLYPAAGEAGARGGVAEGSGRLGQRADSSHDLRSADPGALSPLGASQRAARAAPEGGDGGGGGGGNRLSGRLSRRSSSSFNLGRDDEEGVSLARPSARRPVPQRKTSSAEMMTAPPPTRAGSSAEMMTGGGGGGGDATPQRPGAGAWGGGGGRSRGGRRSGASLDSPARKGRGLSSLSLGVLSGSSSNLLAGGSMTPSRVTTHPLSSWSSVGSVHSLGSETPGSVYSEASDDTDGFGLSPLPRRGPVVGDMARVMGTTATGDVYSPPPTRPKQGKRGRNPRVKSKSHRKPTGGRSPVSSSKSPAHVGPGASKPKAVHQISEDTTYMAWDMVPRAIDNIRRDRSPGSDGTMEKCASDDDDNSMGRPSRGPALKTAEVDLREAEAAEPPPSRGPGLLRRLRSASTGAAAEAIVDRLSLRLRRVSVGGSPPDSSAAAVGDVGDEVEEGPIAHFVSYSPDSSPERERPDAAGTPGRKIATDWGY